MRTNPPPLQKKSIYVYVWARSTSVLFQHKTSYYFKERVFIDELSYVVINQSTGIPRWEGIFWGGRGEFLIKIEFNESSVILDSRRVIFFSSEEYR